MRAKEAVSHVSKPTIAEVSKNKEQTWSWVQTVYLRANGNSQRITTQAQSVCVSFRSPPGPACHHMNDFPEPRHPASPWIPSDPTRTIPSSTVSLAGPHQISNWERETAFNPPVQNSHWSQMFARVHWQQQTSADIPLLLYSSCQSVPAVLWKPSSLSWQRNQRRTSPKLGDGSFLTQQHTSLLACGN